MRTKMLLSYNILPQHHEEYLHYMVNTLVPTLQKLGVENEGVWHTAYGDYPIRLLAFVAEEETFKEVLNSDTWKEMETQLKSYTTEYACRIIEYEPGFQF